MLVRTLAKYRYNYKVKFIPEKHGLSPDFKLLNFSELKGCGCKVPQGTLLTYLDQFKSSIGEETPDVSVEPVANNHQLISTIDFFSPLVDNPYVQGRIACCNVLSDLYAMGATKVATVLMVLGVSLKMNEQERKVVTSLMIEGFNECAREANTSVTGGQTIFNPWPIIGGVGLSVYQNGGFPMPYNAKVGDKILLTKPLGTQVAVNANQWKGLQNEKYKKLSQVVGDDIIDKVYQRAEKQMATLSRIPSELMTKHNVHACTDVTGFGLMGHANYLCKSQKSEVDFILNNIPVIKNTLKIDKVSQNFKLKEGFSAETSGGLFIVMNEQDAKNFTAEMIANNREVWQIGEVVKGNRKAHISENANYIEVD